MATTTIVGEAPKQQSNQVGVKCQTPILRYFYIFSAW